MDESSPPRRGLLPPALLLIALVAMIGLHLVLPLVTLLSGPWRWLGAIPIGAGLTLNLQADGLFKRAGTTVKPFGTTSALVAEGPFALSRNPMYLGMVVLLIGVAIGMGSVTPWVVIPIFVWRIRKDFVLPEERKLRAAFGEEYEAYAGRVRRWI